MMFLITEGRKEEIRGKVTVRKVENRSRSGGDKGQLNDRWKEVSFEVTISLRFLFSF